MTVVRRRPPREGRALELDHAFWDFHGDNPWVYDYFVGLARQLRDAGRRRTSVQLLINRARWDVAVGTISEDGYRINQNHASRYARLIMHREADLDGVFQTRTSAADGFNPRRRPR